MKNQTILLAPLLCCGLILGGCRFKMPMLGAPGEVSVPLQPNTAPDLIEKLPMKESVFEVTAGASQAEFKAKEEVKLHLEVKNTSAEAQTLSFSSGQSFDFSATREGETEPQWNWAMNKRFMQSLRSVKLEAGKSLSFSAIWTGASPGRYTMQAMLTANGGLKAQPFEIVVK